MVVTDFKYRDLSIPGLTCLAWTWLMLLFSCQSKSTADYAASGASGRNRKEIEVFLANYRKEVNNDKKKAAEFILKNLPGQFTLRLILTGSNNSVIPVSADISGDSIEKLCSNPEYHLKWDTIWDIDEFNAGNMIRNINESYFEWKRRPWGRSVPFNMYLAYLLPARIGNERPGVWRDFFIKRYGSFIGDIPRTHADTAKSILSYIQADISTWKDLPFPRKQIQSLCPDSADILGSKEFINQLKFAKLQLMALRSLGVASTYEVVPFLGKRNGGRAYISLPDRDGSFNFEWDSKDIFKYRIPKAFRRVFNSNEPLYNPYAEIKKLGVKEANIPLVLNITMAKDVTRERTVAADITIPLTDRPVIADSIAYLGVLNNWKWEIVDWGKIDKKSGTATFRNIGTDILYHLLLYAGGKKQLVGKPFIVDSLGRWKYFDVNAKKRSWGIISRSDRDSPFLSDSSYMLSYWNGAIHDWTELGEIKIHHGDSTVAKEVPFNALYRIHQMNGAKKERAFSFENSIQKWW